MAVSGKTAAPIEAPYYLSTDKPPDMAAVTKAMAERQHALLNGLALSNLAHGTAGQLIVVQSTGAAAYKTMKGDATLAEDGTLTIAANAVGAAEITDGSVGTAELANGAVTSAKSKPTAGVAVAALPVTLSGSFQTVCSAKVTPVVASTIQLIGFVRVDSPPTLTNLLYAVDGAAESAQTFIKGGNGLGVIIANLSLTAAEHTIALQARRSEGSGGTVEGSAGGGSFSYQLFAA